MKFVSHLITIVPIIVLDYYYTRLILDFALL